MQPDKPTITIKSVYIGRLETLKVFDTSNKCGTSAYNTSEQAFPEVELRERQS